MNIISLKESIENILLTKRLMIFVQLFIFKKYVYNYLCDEFLDNFFFSFEIKIIK